MTEKLTQLAKEQIMKLPKEGQEAINSFDWGKVVEEIGKKYLLDESEINTLQAETLTVLIGLIDLDVYPINIEDDIGISTKDATKIAEDISEKIFTPIGKKIEENIEKNLKDKNVSPEQTLNFILSGGDYSVFVGEEKNTNEKTPTKANTTPTLTDIQANTQKTNPASIKRMEDIRSKFTI